MSTIISISRHESQKKSPACGKERQGNENHLPSGGSPNFFSLFGVLGKVKITLNVYGDLEKFAIPEDKLLESKTVENGLNVYNEKTWEMDVPAGSEVTFEYHYTVFEAK